MHAKFPRFRTHQGAPQEIQVFTRESGNPSKCVDFIYEDKRLGIDAPGPAEYDKEATFTGEISQIKSFFVDASLIDWWETVLASSPGPTSCIVDELTGTNSSKCPRK